MPALLSPLPDSTETVAIESLSSINAVQNALQQADSMATHVEQNLDHQLSETIQSTSHRVSVLRAVTDQANALSHQAHELSSLLASSTRSSDSVCSRIRQLDNILTRGELALSWADDILTLRVCAEGAKTSLSADDLPAAAQHVERYLRLPVVIRQDQASATAVSQMEQSIAELSRKVRHRADELLGPDSNLSVSEAIDSVKLFVPIGLTEQGLEILVSYLTARISRDSEEDVRTLLIDRESSSASDSPSAMDEPHIVALSKLFESIASCIHDCSSALLELFTASALARFIISLQQQCDKSAFRILNRYQEVKDLPQLSRAVRSETANARDLDSVLNELTLLSQRIARYFEFIRHSSTTTRTEPLDDSEVNDATAGLPSDAIMVNDFIAGCELAISLREMATQYTSFEVYFMKENARLAIKIDESNGEDSEISTAVDDFFFVLRNCFQRAMAFGGTEPEVVRAVLQQMSRSLAYDLLAYLKRRLRETDMAMEKFFRGPAAQSSLPAAGYAVSYLTELAKANIAIPGSTEAETAETDSAKYDFFTALNNAAVSADYATRLRSSVEKSLQNSRRLSPEDRTMLATAVAQITDASRALVVATEQGISRLASVLLERVRVLVERNFEKASYVVSEAEYSLDADATPCFSREVAHELEETVLNQTLERRLTEKNWDALVRQVAEWFANQMESKIFLPKQGDGKAFNTFGGLRVDRDVRALSSYFSGKSKRSTVRDVFGRLSQLAMVVNLERPGEMYDMWGTNAGGMTWRLSPNEIRRTLSLRVDFSSDTIRTLKL